MILADQLSELSLDGILLACIEIYLVLVYVDFCCHY